MKIDSVLKCVVLLGVIVCCILIGTQLCFLNESMSRCSSVTCICTAFDESK